jgi:hypothetical protein
VLTAPKVVAAETGNKVPTIIGVELAVKIHSSFVGTGTKPGGQKQLI